MKLKNFVSMLLLATAVKAHAGHSDHKINIHGVPVKSGVKVNITVDVFVDKKKPCSNQNVLALHGMAHTGKAWKKFAEALFADRSSATKVCRFYAINFPGRGGSSLPYGPAGAQLSDLGIEDYTTIALKVTDYFKYRGVKFDSIVGHSAGTIEIEMMQDRLVSQHTDLKRKYGIKQAILIAPSGTGTQLIPDDGTFGGLLDAFTGVVPGVGPVIGVPDSMFTSFFFTNLMGALDPMAPSTAEVTAKGYNSIESVKFAKQVVWAAPETAPVVSAGIFGPGKTKVTVIGGNNDIYIPTILAQGEYVHITGDTSFQRLAIVENEFAIHDMFITNPQWILQALPSGTQF